MQRLWIRMCLHCRLLCSPLHRSAGEHRGAWARLRKGGGVIHRGTSHQRRMLNGRWKSEQPAGTALNGAAFGEQLLRNQRSSKNYWERKLWLEYSQSFIVQSVLSQLWGRCVLAAKTALSQGRLSVYSCGLWWDDSLAAQGSWGGS